VVSLYRGRVLERFHYTLYKHRPTVIPNTSVTESDTFSPHSGGSRKTVNANISMNAPVNGWALKMRINSKFVRTGCNLECETIREHWCFHKLKLATEL